MSSPSACRGRLSGNNAARRLGRSLVGPLAILWFTSAAAACDASAKIEGAYGRYILLAEGDSITAVSNDDFGAYPPRACVPKINGIETIVTAHPTAALGAEGDRAGSNTVYARIPSDNAILARKGNRIAILSILIGRNDLQRYGPKAYADRLGQYIDTMRRAGWDLIVVGTLLPSTSKGYNAARNDLNAILTAPDWTRAHRVDAIADFAGSPVMGPDSAAANKDLYVDGTHPTDRGFQALVPIYDAALKAVITHSR